MKKSFTYLLTAFAALILSGCGMSGNQNTPQGYVRHCVRILDAEALYTDTPQWSECKKATLEASKSFTTFDQAHEAIAAAAKVAGGKHSTLSEPVRDTTSYLEIAPEAKMMDCGIAQIMLPAHSGVKISDSLYVHTVLDFLEENTDAKGVIIDLRGNRGGNMYPMIAAVSPLIPDGVILRFTSRKRTSPVYLVSILQYEGISEVKKFPSSTPVAILTDDWTASSGEATLLCFRGLDNVRTFGCLTAGYASANVPHILADGYSLVVTTSCDEARTGEVFCDDPIAPDVETDNPLEDAVAWISATTIQ